MKETPTVRQRTLNERTKAFALSIIRFYSRLPRTGAAGVIARQLLRSGTSVGAHYREAARGRSDAEFISKLEGGLQELEETSYWMELLVESDLMPPSAVTPLMDEARELNGILTACVKKVKTRLGRC